VLTELRIRNVGVIDDVTLVLGEGLNVLTGETGAGKTMVVSALELLLGGRADGDLVRAGAAAAVIEGSVAPAPPSAAEWLDDEDDELIVAREVAAPGASAARSRARIGGRMAPISALAACMEATVELHAQQDSSRLSSPAVQRELLDRFGGPTLTAALENYRRCFAAWTAARDELEMLQSSEQDRVREADRLRFELEQIDTVAPADGEEEALRADIGRLEHAEALTAAAQTAAAALTDEGAGHDLLATAAASLAPVHGVDAQLDSLRDRLVSLTAEAADVGMELRAYATAVEADPAALELHRDRYAALVRLTRKYGDAANGEIDSAGVLAYAEQARARLHQLDTGDQRSEELAGAVGRLAADLDAEAQRVRDERIAAGKRLAATVEGHLAELGMAGARMDVSVEATAPAQHGADRVVFGLAANPGEPTLPLGKAASGGERSRVALAVRLALADADRTPVLVFDEVDAGIGGATAAEVGRKLARLAKGRQVLCVTHLAQLAAHADRHFSVTKQPHGDRTVAVVAELDEDRRVAELSRMLSGADTEAATDHARELLRRAQRAG